MRRYLREDEERLRAQALVREWTRSGLLEPAQQVRLESELQVDLKRTNPFLRAVLALFTTLIVVAGVALILLELGVHDRVSIAVIAGLAALGCIGLAEYLIATFRLYRFGSEEALGAERDSTLASGTCMPRSVPSRAWRPCRFDLTCRGRSSTSSQRRRWQSFSWPFEGSVLSTATITLAGPTRGCRLLPWRRSMRR